MPDVSVSHNNAYEVTGNWNQAVWEGVSDLCDFCTGDLYGDIYNASFCNKFFLGATKNMPYEYMVSRFSKNLRQHTLTKTDTEFLQSTLLTVAHHGANFVIDAIDPVETLDTRVASLIGRTYEKQIPYEKYIKSGENIVDVAVWYSITGRYNTEGQDFDNRTCSVTLTKTMIQSHIPVRVIGNTQSSKLDKNKIVIASSIAGLEDQHRNDILKYVENGGVFIFSGYEEPELLKAFFGAEQKAMSIPKHSYIAPTKENETLFCGFNDKYPLPMTFNHPIIEDVESDTEILAYLNLPYYNPDNERNFSSIHSNPPGKTTKHPSVIKKKYGNGYAVWLGLPIEGTDIRQHKDITVNLIRSFLQENEQSVITNAPMQVELVTFAEDNTIQISVIDMGVTNERRNIEEFDICVSADRVPTGVRLLPDKTAVFFEVRDGRVCFKTRKLDIFDMYRIEF